MTSPTPGVRTWAHLEELEAVDLVDYLMSQSCPRFASEAERDAQMAAPVEGQHCYVIGVGEQWFDGTAWLAYEGPQGPQGEPGTPSPVDSVAGRIGAVVLTKADVGLTNADDTSDANKPVSTAQAAADALKVSKAGDTMTGLLALAAGGADAGGLTIGGDANLYRSGANVLATSDTFGAAVDLFARYGDAANQSKIGLVGGKAGITLGTLGDTTFYRDSAGIVRTSSEFRIEGVIRASFVAGAGAVNIGAVGPSSTAAIVLGADCNLYRSAADILKTDDALQVGGSVGFYNTAPVAKGTVTGSRGGNAALASLLTALAATGLITDSSTA
jgi:hypothetical protein